AIASVVTDAKGNYSITGIRPGNYQLMVSHPAYSVAPTNVSLTAGARVQKPLAASPRARISGTVVDDEKRAVAAATINADTASRGGAEDDETVRTGSDGKFMTRVKEGTYDVVFKREGFSTKTVRAVAANATSKPIEVALEPGVEITGRVSRGGSGVEGINVAV